MSMIKSFLLVVYMYIYVYERPARSIWMQWVRDKTCEVYINDISCECKWEEVYCAMGQSLYWYHSGCNGKKLQWKRSKDSIDHR